MTPAQRQLMSKVVRESPITYTDKRKERPPRVMVQFLAHPNTVSACVKRGWLAWASYRHPGDSVRLTDKGREAHKRATFKIDTAIRESIQPIYHPQARCALPDKDVLTYASDTVARVNLAAKVRAYFEARFAPSSTPKHYGCKRHEGCIRYTRAEDALRVAVGLEPRK